MLVARIAPPLPGGGLSLTMPSGVLSGRRAVEIVASLSGALARGLAGDLRSLGYEVAWIRPLRFEADGGSLAPLLVTALSAARREAPGQSRPVVVVVESPTAAQAEAILGQLPAPGLPFGPTAVLLVPEEQDHRPHPAGMARVHVPPPAWPRQREPAGPAGKAEAAARRLLREASHPQLAALEMAAHLGYAHARFGSLEPVVPAGDGPRAHPWWVPLEDGWWQVDPAWRPALTACMNGSGRAARCACVSRLVAELTESDAVAEGIELCVNAGWPGLAADLLAGEADALLSAGRHLAVVSWLERLPKAEARCHPGLAALAADLVPAEKSPASRAPEPLRRPWMLRILGRRAAGVPPPRAALATIPQQPGEASGLSRPGQVAALPPGIRPGPGGDDGQARAGNQEAPVRIEARLLGQFEVLVQGQPVPRWTGSKGRMLLAYLLLHRGRALSRGELGCAFWPDDEPGVVRNRLNVTLYGLRKDLRALTPHPVVVHGQRGFTLDEELDLWTDVAAFDEAFAAAKREKTAAERSGCGDRALDWYEKALSLYRGELLAETPFEEWALLDRERLRMASLETLDQVAVLRFKAGRYADCLEACQRLMPGDVCREEIHRMAMRCYARLNQPHLAARQYHLCERQLQDELGVAPDTATRQLYDRIRRREFV